MVKMLCNDEDLSTMQTKIASHFVCNEHIYQCGGCAGGLESDLVACATYFNMFSM